MSNKPISPKTHAILDYALIGSLFVVPALFKFSKKTRKIYAVEGAVLAAYVAVSDLPLSVTPLIPYRTHGKVDAVNTASFALQTALKPFKKERKAIVFNILFAAISAASVLLTDWKARER